MTRPPSRPTCKHGNSPGYCSSCQQETLAIREKIKPLVDEFWEHHGQLELDHLMVRAYRMGMAVTKGGS